MTTNSEGRKRFEQKEEDTSAELWRWQRRAETAEEKLQALREGIQSDEEFDRMMIYNPIASAIAYHAVEKWRREHDV